MRIIAALVGGLFALVGLAVFLWVSTSAEQTPLDDGLEADAPAAYLGGTESRVLTSSVNGRAYQISVALPYGYAESTERYAVLYGVDANGQFGTLVETARILRLGEQIPPLIVVGIGFPVGGYQISSRPRRLLELTTSHVEGYRELVATTWPDEAPPDGSGGAPELLRFIREQLIPMIDAEYRTIPGDRALYGHSQGGSFAFYSLLHGEGAFSRFIIGSPSLWWDDGVAFEFERQFAEEHRALPAKVFFAVGLLESDEIREPLGNGRLISNLRDLVAVLEERQYEGLVWETHFFEDENHQSVLPGTISRGLRYIYGDQ